MARSLQVTVDELKALIPNLSVTEYALVEITPENAPFNPTGGNASHGSGVSFSEVEAEESNRRYAPMRYMPASQHHVQSYSVFPGTVMMGNAASDPAERDTVYHLRTICTHQQVVQTVGLHYNQFQTIYVPQNIVPTVSGVVPNYINQPTVNYQIMGTTDKNSSVIQDRTSSVSQSSLANKFKSNSQLIIVDNGEGRSLCYFKKDNLTQDCGEQQQILAQQDHSTKQSQQIVTRPTGIQRDHQTQTSFVRDHQTVTVTKPCPENSRTTSQKSSQAVGQTLGKLEFTSRIVPLNANRRRLIGHGVLEPSSAHSSGEIPISRKRYLEKSERTFCKKPRIRFQEDPEILTISSDEDEETESKLDVKSKEEYFLDPVTGLLTINSMDEPVLPPITSALEPVIKEEENPITDEETDFAEEIAGE